MDARYNKVRIDHKVESNAVLIAKAVNRSGMREIIGVDVCNNETNRSSFFKSLKQRGLSGVKPVISDAHGGLVSAIERYYPGTEWQRCQVHFKKNILDKVRIKDKAWIKQRLDDVFHAPDKETGYTRLIQLIEDLSSIYPQVADLPENDGEDAITCLNYPTEHHKRIRTINSLERFNQEIKRRTNVIRIFPNRDSAVRLIGALCMEQSEEWITGRQYLDMILLEKHEKEQKSIKPKPKKTVAA